MSNVIWEKALQLFSMSSFLALSKWKFWLKTVLLFGLATAAIGCEHSLKFDGLKTTSPQPLSKGEGLGRQHLV